MTQSIKQLLWLAEPDMKAARPCLEAAPIAVYMHAHQPLLTIAHNICSQSTVQGCPSGPAGPDTVQPL